MHCARPIWHPARCLPASRETHFSAAPFVRSARLRGWQRRHSFFGTVKSDPDPSNRSNRPGGGVTTRSTPRSPVSAQPIGGRVETRRLAAIDRSPPPRKRPTCSKTRASALHGNRQGGRAIARNRTTISSVGKRERQPRRLRALAWVRRGVRILVGGQPALEHVDGQKSKRPETSPFCPLSRCWRRGYEARGKRVRCRSARRHDPVASLR